MDQNLPVGGWLCWLMTPGLGKLTGLNHLKKELFLYPTTLFCSTAACSKALSWQRPGFCSVDSTHSSANMKTSVRPSYLNRHNKRETETQSGNLTCLRSDIRAWGRAGTELRCPDTGCGFREVGQGLSHPQFTAWRNNGVPCLSWKRGGGEPELGVEPSPYHQSPTAS